MNPELLALVLTAAGIGVVHTLLGPDHYVPFVAMARAGHWSLRRTLLITWVCGIGHVFSSVVIGVLGLGIGAAVLRADRVDQLTRLEAARGNVAGWMLIAFGACYLAWGIRRSIRRRPHAHVHAHEDGIIHSHEHAHEHDHLHVHGGRSRRSVTPWLLFIIFLFGPCEALIPILMLPAALHGGALPVVLVCGVFTIATLATMTCLVAVGHFGLSAGYFHRLARHGTAIAGGMVLACGIAIKSGL